MSINLNVSNVKPLNTQMTLSREGAGRCVMHFTIHAHSCYMKYLVPSQLVTDVKLNLPKMMDQKRGAVKALTGGIAGLFKKNGVRTKLCGKIDQLLS